MLCLKEGLKKMSDHKINIKAIEHETPSYIYVSVFSTTNAVSGSVGSSTSIASSGVSSWDTWKQECKH